MAKAEAAPELASAALRGERLTPQRRAIWQAFVFGHGHLTVEAIRAALEPPLDHLTTGTVYRELGWLKRHGLISETDVGCGAKVYERVTEPNHHHLICLQCGGVGDLPDDYVFELRRRLHDEKGFAARIEHLAVYGVCAHCVDEAEAPPKS